VIQCASAVVEYIEYIIKIDLFIHSFMLFNVFKYLNGTTLATHVMAAAAAADGAAVVFVTDEALMR
jgi:hypothetical protein